MSAQHQDLEFHAQQQGSESTAVCETWDNALRHLAGEPGVIDVVTWSRDAAIAFGGDDAGEQYDEDPEASVFERWIRREANGQLDSQGRVP